jgi:cobalt-zinc-cadmium efflux system membrane fusion protein
MNNKQKLSIAAIAVITALLAVFILTAGKSKSAEGAAETTEKSEGASAGEKHGSGASAKGPHGGQLYVHNGLGAEVALVEEGGVAHLFVYPMNQDKAQPTGAVQLKATLKRPTGTTEDLAFTMEKTAFKSKDAIPEPHLFDIAIQLSSNGKSSEFTFSKEEGKIEIDDAQILAAGTVIKVAGPRPIDTSIQLPGEIRFNEDRTAHVVPRVVGVVDSVPVTLGQLVKKGQVLAVISSSAVSEQRSELMNAQQQLSLAQTTYSREKNLWEEKISAQQDYLQAQQALREAEINVRNAQQKLNAIGATSGKAGLNQYEIRAPFDGMVVEKHISLGESVKEDANIFTVSDLSTVWAEVIIPAKDLNSVRVGAPVSVKATAFDSTIKGKISYVGSLLGEQTRTAKAHVVLPNPDNTWRPGLFVNVAVTANQANVPVAVSADAIQSVDQKNVVFVRIPGGFVAQEVTLGRADTDYVEIVEGLKADTQYAAAGSFVIKAQLGKGSAEHSH